VAGLTAATAALTLLLLALTMLGPGRSPADPGVDAATAERPEAPAVPAKGVMVYRPYEFWLLQDGPAHGTDLTKDMATVPGGGVYTCGSETGLITLTDWNVRRIGGASQWAASYNGAADSYDEAVALAVGPKSSLYVCGYVTNAAFDRDAVLMRYSATGTRRFLKRWTGGTDVDAQAVALAVRGDGTCVVAVNAIVTATSRAKLVLIKYSGGGTVLWTRSVGGTGSDTNTYASDLCLDADGNVYACGSRGFCGAEAYVVKYSAGGSRRWLKTYDPSGSSNNQFRAICRRPGGGVYVAGLTAPGNDPQGIVCRYSATGSRTMLERFGAGDAKDAGLNDVHVDADGRVVACGNIAATDASDWLTAVIRPDGALAWSRTAGDVSGDIATCVSTDADGRVFVVGAIASGGVAKVRALAYSRSGSPMWLGDWTTLAPAIGARPEAVALRSSKLWVAGSTGGPGGTQDQLLLRWSTE
jgi:outer membrane protein assembly factor BamB